MTSPPDSQRRGASLSCSVCFSSSHGTEHTGSTHLQRKEHRRPEEPLGHGGVGGAGGPSSQLRLVSTWGYWGWAPHRVRPRVDEPGNAPENLPRPGRSRAGLDAPAETRRGPQQASAHVGALEGLRGRRGRRGRRRGRRQAAEPGSTEVRVPEPWRHRRRPLSRGVTSEADFWRSAECTRHDKETHNAPAPATETERRLCTGHQERERGLRASGEGTETPWQGHLDMMLLH